MKISINPYDGVDVDAARVAALAKIEEGARNARQSYVGEPAQLFVYEQKAQEAAAVLNGVGGEATLIGQEAAERGLQIEEMAAIIAAKSARWKYANAQIELSRVRWKKAIAECESASSIARALMCFLGEMKDLRNIK